jgi:hypothetical protein
MQAFLYLRINKSSFFLVLITLLLFACTQHKTFDKRGWQERGDLGLYPNRSAMLKALTSHYRLKGLSYKQLVDSLGESEGFSDTKANTAYYNIVTDYGKDIDPVYVKNLIITLDADSVVSSVGIEEIKH